MKKILFIDHSFHKTTRSSEFFIEFLRTFANITIEWDDAWQDGIVKKDYTKLSKDYDLTIVWQMPEVILQLAEQKKSDLIFIPMYDAAHSLDRKFWRKLKHIKIICFSVALEVICKRYRLDTYAIQFYPEKFSPAPIGYAKKHLFFWQRREWPNWGTVCGILPTAQFVTTHVHIALDPSVTTPVMPTESEINHHNITTSRWFDKKDDLLAVINNFNIYFIPRDREGIGFSFLDAMSHGMLPVGFNEATFNEYVVNGINGFIVSNKTEDRFDLPDLMPMAENAQHYILKGRTNYERRLEGLKQFLFKQTSVPNYWLSGTMHHRLRLKSIATITATRKKCQSAEPLITVVTVVRNDAAGLSRTLKSIFTQSLSDFEYIIVDGKSSDATPTVIKDNSESIDQVLTEEDAGPYDAMSKGARLAHGKYIIFMNAGDEFSGPTALEDAIQSIPEDVDIIYGHHFYILGNGRPRVHMAGDLNATYKMLKRGKISHKWLHGIPCHQSTLVSRKLLLKIGFDTKFRIAADHAFLFSACAIGARLYHTNTFIANYYSGGMSATSTETCTDEWENIALSHTDDRKSVIEFYSSIKLQSKQQGSKIK